VNHLNDFRVDASYYWRNKFVLTVEGFDTWGSSDPVLYSANTNPAPDTSGYMIQLDATPWGNGKSPLGPRFNVRVGVQYFGYLSYNGSVSNFDGAGTSASDNNTVRVFTWIAY
jgi:hypothetical protein